MHLVSILLFVCTATALSLPDITGLTQLLPRKNGGSSNSGSGSGNSGSGNSGSSNGKCPPVWTTISKELTKKFLSGNECTPDARAAIRLVFHDCGAWNIAQGAKGGCDGSIILNSEENARAENKGLQSISTYILSLSTKYSVSVADLIVFAGNHAVVTCPGGPQIRTLINRPSSSTPAPNNLLPPVDAPPAQLAQLALLFSEKGFSPRDLAALLGAHTTSNQFHFNASTAGAPQDSTPGVWDVKYYAETLKPPRGVVVFPSDSGLAGYGEVGKEFRGFVGNQGKWTGKFEEAMGKMGMFGGRGEKGMVDCTGALPGERKIKREVAF